MEVGEKKSSLAPFWRRELDLMFCQDKLEYPSDPSQNPPKATKIKVLIVFLVDQEFKRLRLIKDGSDISFFVEGIGNSADSPFSETVPKLSSTKATKVKFIIVFLVDQEFKRLRLIKDGLNLTEC